MRTLNFLVATKQLSIYLILLSLVVSSAMMRPSFVTFLFAVPINAAILFTLRWVAQVEGGHF